MRPTVPLATVLVLPDLRPLAARLRSALRHLSASAAADLELQAERAGRAIVFRGDACEALRLAEALKAAGLVTSLNRLG